VHPREALDRHGVVQVRVVTTSMVPTLRPGDTVLVRAAAPVLGDVVLLDTPGGPTLHRLVARFGLCGRLRWVHAGDAPQADGGLAAPDTVLGVAELDRSLPPLSRRVRLIGSALARAWRARI
jgi:hypothetical protein